MEPNELLQKINKLVPGAILEKQRFGRSAKTCLWVESEKLRELCMALKNDPAIALDWLENLSAMQLEDALVFTYFIRSSRTKERLILRSSVELTSPTERTDFQSLAGVWGMAEPQEREIAELFGIRFLDENGVSMKHTKAAPNHWKGFPLRKSFVFDGDKGTRGGPCR
ncbi:MAG: hypothetical protein A2428_04690 [Bdellovibrionales bacterium RIFOXYC1_FULL_54_43]|nr:MAG: hypothetical protein A2428_04690 [Bdellovibrionales bacterium RIFOXYC1_FULL_54_43]OFZ78861.1 MAG: hypothetical protein A2603_08560 [Bdellovibrionales bacterium RIFOXYD1_FULL_55_31]